MCIPNLKCFLMLQWYTWNFIIIPLGKYFNIELKSIVAQPENLAAKGIFVVRAPLRFFYSFRLNKKNPAIFSQINSWTNSKDFDIKFVVITPSKSILIFSWIITNFQKLACFEQFVWSWCNIFARFYALDVVVRTCSFIFLRLFCGISSFYAFQLYARTSHPLKKVRLEKSGSLYLGCKKGSVMTAKQTPRCAPDLN